MTTRLALTVIGALLALTGCGGTEPDAGKPQPSDATPTVSYVESDTCREDARPVIELLELTMNDEDVQDAATRLAAIEEMGATPTAACTSAVTGPVRDAVKGFGCAIDIAAELSGAAKCEGTVMDNRIAGARGFGDASRALDAVAP